MFTKKYTNKLFCFSPPVMLATFIIEISFAIYIVWRYKLNRISRLVVAILVGLATFQLAEYMVCGGLGWTGFEWARLGYASITLLPPLGIHLATAIAGRRLPWLLAAGYLSALGFALFYVFVAGAVTGQTCYANYIVFDTMEYSYIPFAVYYYGWLFVGVHVCLKWAKEQPKNKKALASLAVGYLSFILPTTTVNLIDPSTMNAIPSIMCGFGVILAYILTVKVAPEAAIKRR